MPPSRSYAIQWSDHDRYFGPFTYASEKGNYRPFAIMLGSGDGDEYPGCRLRLSAFGRTLITRLPAIIRPWKQWVDTSQHSWSPESGGYLESGEREYGFILAEGHLSVAFGRVTNDSSTEERWSYSLPWMQWRQVRRSFYGLGGEHVSTLPESRRGEPSRWESDNAIAEACPTVTFAFTDFDGERLAATTRIEEQEWRAGEGWFKWLSWFRKAKIDRNLDIQFSGETGERKGSWKGGTLAHSISMLPGELHEGAFRRYCAENSMTFVAAT